MLTMASLISVFRAKNNRFVADHIAMISIASFIPFATIAEKIKPPGGDSPGTEQFTDQRSV